MGRRGRPRLRRLLLGGLALLVFLPWLAQLLSVVLDSPVTYVVVAVLSVLAAARIRRRWAHRGLAPLRRGSVERMPYDPVIDPTERPEEWEDEWTC